MRDPQNVYSGECQTCHTIVPDDQDLNPNADCSDCAKDLAIDALDEARVAMIVANSTQLAARLAYEAALQHAYDVGADLPARDWLAIAADIVGVHR
jgi:hypothetical protein